MKLLDRLTLRKILIGLCCIVIAASGWYLYDNTVDRSGWVERNGTYYYRDFHAKKVTGWQEIDGGRYYFGKGKAMVTHWQEIGENRYYFGRDGKLDIGWLDIDGKRYYADEAGVIQTFWTNVGAERFYLGSDGAITTGWQEIDGKRYYMGDRGAMHSGWLEDGGHTYYFGENGAMITGWLTVEKGKFYFDTNGWMLTGHQTINTEQYLFREDGTMHTGWEDTEEARFYYGQDGARVTGWQEIDGKRYYFRDDGTMYTGWLEQGEYRYYLQEDGSAAVGPVKIGWQTYYFTPKGIHVVLVNYRNAVPGYYKVDLVTVVDYHRVSSVCYDALVRMLEDCVAAGNQYVFNSAYRTIEQQTEILDLRTKEHMETYNMTFEQARAKALQTVAVPGTSEHHLGLAVDLLGEDAIAWLTEHCWEYGFIVRYRGEKAHITGIIDEPWHFRYVGTEISLDMKDSGLCLEEYLGAA